MIATPYNPYVGPRTFEEADADRFFGREREARELVALIVSEQLTLFFAQSGAGKSSLLNARVIPALRDQEGFNVLPVGRVSGVLPPDVNPGDIANIYAYHLIWGLSQTIAGQGEADGMVDREQQPLDLVHTSLARFLSGETGPDLAPNAALESAPPAEALAPHVLIIDQFEELLTTYPERWQERAGFFEQLNAAMARHPNLWVVLTLREDYVASLERYSHLVTNQLRARFYMQRMGVEAAREAVERPAARAGHPFGEGVAGMLVDNLRMVRAAGKGEYHAGEYVEPVQLQVVCFQLWEDLRDRETPGIQLADLERLAGGGNLAEYVDGALSDFYERAIRSVLDAPGIGVTELVLRNWFSKEMITEDGTRSIVFRNETTGKTEGLPNRAVDLLSDQFLLRSEQRAGGRWVELVHDRFVEPIQISNRAWLARNQNSLTQAAQAWLAAGKPAGQLYAGSQLTSAVAQVESRPDEFGDAERAFVEAGREAQRRTNARRQSALLAATAALVFVFAALAVWGYQQTKMANQAMAAAVADKMKAQAAIAAQATSLESQRITLQISLASQVIAPERPTPAPATPAATDRPGVTPVASSQAGVSTPGALRPTPAPSASNTVPPPPASNPTVIAQQTQLALVGAQQVAVAAALAANKLGFYIDNPDLPGLREAIRSVHPPVIVMKSPDRALLQDIRNGLSPDSFIVGFMPYFGPDKTPVERLVPAWLNDPHPEDRGRDFADHILHDNSELALERANGRLLVDAWVSLNEAVPGPESAAFSQNPAEIGRRLHAYDAFQVGFRDKLQERGIEAVAFNFAAGNFGFPKEYLDFFPKTLASYTYLGFHEYGWPALSQALNPATSSSAGTYRRCVQGLQQALGKQLLAVITEAGLARMYRYPSAGLDVGWQYPDDPISQDAYWRSLDWYNGIMVQDDYVLGAALFNVGQSGQWETFRHIGVDNQGNPLTIIDRIAALGSSTR